MASVASVTGPLQVVTTQAVQLSVRCSAPTPPTPVPLSVSGSATLIRSRLGASRHSARSCPWTPRQRVGVGDPQSPAARWPGRLAVVAGERQRPRTGLGEWPALLILPLKRFEAPLVPTTSPVGDPVLLKSTAPAPWSAPIVWTESMTSSVPALVTITVAVPPIWLAAPKSSRRAESAGPECRRLSHSGDGERARGVQRGQLPGLYRGRPQIRVGGGPL